MAYLNISKLPTEAFTMEYVCFMDVMGTQALLKRGMNTTANFVLKLHSTILSTTQTIDINGVNIYPVMDGAYITCPDSSKLCNFVSKVFLSIMKEDLLPQTNYAFWYLVRAAIAYGEVLHGNQITYMTSRVLQRNKLKYTNKLAIGAPFIYAYQLERSAAPMGVVIHESASNMHISIRANWKWYKNRRIHIDLEQVNTLKERLLEYYQWLDSQEHLVADYPKEKRKIHSDRITAYFSAINN